MNITYLAKQWLIKHEHYEDEPTFKKDLLSLCELIESVRYHPGHVGDEPEYDPNFGDDKLCLCGHTYYRHFDPYENMDPVGCKYCCQYGEKYGQGTCLGFKEASEHKADCGCKSCVGM